MKIFKTLLITTSLVSASAFATEKSVEMTDELKSLVTVDLASDLNEKMAELTIVDTVAIKTELLAEVESVDISAALAAIEVVIDEQAAE